MCSEEYMKIHNSLRKQEYLEVHGHRLLPSSVYSQCHFQLCCHLILSLLHTSGTKNHYHPLLLSLVLDSLSDVRVHSHLCWSIIMRKST